MSLLSHFSSHLHFSLYPVLSGIGPANQLELLGIKSIVDIPDVGQNMQDHPQMTLPYSVSSNNTLDNLSFNAIFVTKQLALWQSNHAGYFTLGECN